MNFIKGKFLLKLHNCIFCHKIKIINKNYPKINNQFKSYLFWALNQYNIYNKKKLFKRNNFIMSSQLQNLSLNDLISIIYFISNIFVI